jgi:trigger factor
MNVVAQRYGYSVQYEVMNDKVGEAFSLAANEAKVRVAGQPRISEKEGAPEGELAFDAIFEVYPEVVIQDLSQVEVETLQAQVTEEAIDKTVEILRKQKRTFAQRAMDAAAAKDDRVTVDFIGKIDGEPFDGGRAEDFQFVVGEGQMLKEFEEAVQFIENTIRIRLRFQSNHPSFLNNSLYSPNSSSFLSGILNKFASFLTFSKK